MSFTLGGYSYWAREILEIPGMANRTTVQGHDGDVSPARLLYAEKTDCTTGATGVNYYPLLDEAAITPIKGGDLHAGPFVSDFEGKVEFSREVEADRFPTVLIRTTHIIPGQDKIESIRAVPTAGLLIGLNETSSVSLSEFNSMVNLLRDVPNGGKIGLQIHIALTMHDAEDKRNNFIRKIQAGEDLNAAEVPIINKVYKMVLTNPAVSFLQWTEAVSGSGGGVVAGSYPITVASCDRMIAAIQEGIIGLSNKTLHQVQLPDGAFYTRVNIARLQAALPEWELRRSRCLDREGNYNRQAYKIVSHGK